MRLIDADALINATIKNPLHAPYITAVDVEHAPTVGEWISMKDRLPENAGWYLVKYNTKSMTVAFFKGKTWPFNNHYHVITHWMPLPEPPEGAKCE